ncbi:MAG: hypothetical protein ACR2H3_13270 [Acidimicrobiales bacterium]
MDTPGPDDVELAAGFAGIRWKRIRPQQLKGLGRVGVWVAESASEAPTRQFLM